MKVRTPEWVTREWPVMAIAVILAVVVSSLAILRARASQPAGAESSDAEAVMVVVQHLAFLMILMLAAWHQRRVLRFLLGLMARNRIIGAEIVLLLAVVYGAFESFGVPELFWDESPVTVVVAGFSSAVFMAMAWFAVYLVDFSQPVRSRRRRLEWNRLEPIVAASGLPGLIRIPTSHLGPRGEVGWYLMVACLPGLLLLALPGFLPAIRPSSQLRVVEWPWLLGLALGTVAAQSLLITRPISRIALEFGRWRGKTIPGDRSRELFRHPGVLLWLLALIYFVSLAVDQIRPTWVVPSALFCLLLAMIAVGVAVFGSIRSRKTQLGVILVALGILLLNGVQTYDPCYTGLAAYYPPDPLRRLIGLHSPFSASAASSPVDLVEFQANDGGPQGRIAAAGSRTAILDAWKKRLGEDGQPGSAPARKPILVAVATCGGALRAGLWTATVLDAISRELPEFPGHVRYITGASGGMVGAALFATSQVKEAGTDPGVEVAHRTELASRFSRDYLSPIARQFILRDLLSFVFPLEAVVRSRART